MGIELIMECLYNRGAYPTFTVAKIRESFDVGNGKTVRKNRQYYDCIECFIYLCARHSRKGRLCNNRLKTINFNPKC